MQAPVYRHLDAKATFAGLSFPLEWMLVLGVAFAFAAFDYPTVGMGAAAGVYVFVRAFTYGKPESHVQHYGMWLLRRLLYAGRLSAAERVRGARFPFGPYLFRDRPRRAA